MIQLHYFPSTASMVPHILLEEIGAPYELVLVDRLAHSHKTPGFLELNPNGLLPVLVEDGLVLYETAAIALHLSDRHPRANLLPVLGSDARSHAYKWLMWLTNTLQATLIVYFYPDRWVDAGNTGSAAEVRHRAHMRVIELLQQVEAHLATHDGPWFMGTQYSLLDAYLFTLCRWTRNFPYGRARELPLLGAYLGRMLERPAVQRVMANEELSPPYV